MNRDRSTPIPEGPVIPKQTYSLVKRSTTRDQLHPGLLLDKFSKFPKEDIGIQEEQCTALNEVCKIQGDSTLLSMVSVRRSQMLTASNAITLPMRTQGAMTLHLSRSGAWENAGISLHPIYGFVYLPGSGLKGLARAWAETVWAPAQSDQKEAWRTIEEAFGYTPNSEKDKEETKKSGWRPSEIPVPAHSSTGQLIFHDAWPLKWPRLIVDIANSHHSKYYRGEQDPDDTENPNPVYFLAVGAGVEFEFAVSDRKLNTSALLDQGIEWLRDALTIQGAGAKTAAGYGRFMADPPKSVHESPKIIRKEYDLELISMAFLAGANQKQQDCDLRPATLRGLLRWWWRTMHTAHVDLESLRKLEASIWGDSDISSPVCIQLQRLNSHQPIPFKAQNFDLPAKNTQHRAKKQTLGLAYASYGMENNRRWYQPEGSTWCLTVRTRSGFYKKGKNEKISLKAETIHQQVEAAIWLFTKYGGAGAKSRKGFGSFTDVKINGVDSIDHCKNIGKRLREACSLSPSSECVKAPSLEKTIIMNGQPTGTDDPAVAVHYIGELIQDFSSQLKQDKQDRSALGMPRMKWKGHHSIPKRHASPALWGLSRGSDGMIKIRMVGFISEKLPQSRAILKDLNEYAINKLQIKAKIATNLKGRPDLKPSHDNSTRKRRHQNKTVTQQESRIPSPGDTVTAILVDEKTKKGGWKAKHIDSGRIGHMDDPQNAPSDVSIGQEVDLIVASVPEGSIAFRWEPLQRKKSQPKRK